MRVLLADDHQLLRQAMRRALEDAGLSVIAEAGDGGEAVRLAAELKPDVVLMDVSMPVLDGVEATRRLHADFPDLPIVILTMHGDDALRRDAVAAGATGFLTKDVSMQEVVATVTQVGGGDVALSTELAVTILAEMEDGKDKPPSPLTPREEEVLQLIADGCSTSEVASNLFISGKTVKNHLASIYEKLEARDRTQAVLSAVRIGSNSAPLTRTNPIKPGLYGPVLTNGAAGLFSRPPSNVILCSAPQPESARGNFNLTAGGQTSMDLFLVKTWLKARMNVDTERGATMVEYVLILALIAILVIGVVAALGHSVSSKFSEASSGIG